jgi:hypothetical protein
VIFSGTVFARYISTNISILFYLEKHLPLLSICAELKIKNRHFALEAGSNGTAASKDALNWAASGV